MFVCVSVCVEVHSGHTGVCRGQKRALEPLELVVELLVSHPV